MVITYNTIRVASSIHNIAVKTQIMQLYSSEMIKMVIGSFRIHGQQDGDKVDTLDSQRVIHAISANVEE